MNLSGPGKQLTRTIGISSSWLSRFERDLRGGAGRVALRKTNHERVGGSVKKAAAASEPCCAHRDGAAFLYSRNVFLRTDAFLCVLFAHRPPTALCARMC